MNRKRINLLIIGNIEKFEAEILQQCSEMNVSVILLASFDSYFRIDKEFYFDVILADIHLDQNYDGLSISSKLDCSNFSTLGLLTEDIDEKTIISSFKYSSTKYLLIPKTLRAIKNLLFEKFLLHFESEALMVPA